MTSTQELTGRAWRRDLLDRLIAVKREMQGQPVADGERRALVQGVLHLQWQFERDHGADRATEVLAEALCTLTRPSPRGRRREALLSADHAWKRYAAAVAHRLIREGWQPGMSSAPAGASDGTAGADWGLSAPRRAEIAGMTAQECLDAVIRPHAVVAIVKAVRELCPRNVSGAEITETLRQLVTTEETLLARYPDEQASVVNLVSYALNDLLTRDVRYRDDLIAGSTIGLIRDERRDIIADAEPTRWWRYVRGTIRAAAPEYISSLRAAPRAERAAEPEMSAEQRIDAVLRQCAALNEQSRTAEARTLMRERLPTILDAAAAHPAMDGDPSLARRHMLHAFKHGLDDWVYVRDYAPVLDYLPEWTWEADETRTDARAGT